MVNQAVASVSLSQSLSPQGRRLRAERGVSPLPCGVSTRSPPRVEEERPPSPGRRRAAGSLRGGGQQRELKGSVWGLLRGCGSSAGGGCGEPAAGAPRVPLAPKRQGLRGGCCGGGAFLGSRRRGRSPFQVRRVYKYTGKQLVQTAVAGNELTVSGVSP